MWLELIENERRFRGLEEEYKILVSKVFEFFRDLEASGSDGDLWEWFVKICAIRSILGKPSFSECLSWSLDFDNSPTDKFTEPS